MVREVLCDCGVSRLWLERYSARVDYTGDASLQKSEVRSRRAPPRDEVKGFRIACGEFIGVSMWAGKSWKIQEWLWCHKEFPVPKVCLPRAAGAVPWNRKSAMERGVFSFRCGRHAAGSHCFGGGSEQNRRPSLHLEKVSQPQDRFTGWQLGTWGDPSASFEFRTLPHPPRKRRVLSYLRLVCGVGFANPMYRAARVPIFRGGVGEAGPISLELNSPTCTRSSKPMQIRFVRDPFSGYFRVTFLLRGCRRGKPRQGFAVVPGHSLRRVLPQLLRVPLQLGQIVERIDTIEFARVNQAHEQVSQRSACSRARAKSSSGIRASIA